MVSEMCESSSESLSLGMGDKSRAMREFGGGRRGGFGFGGKKSLTMRNLRRRFHRRLNRLCLNRRERRTSRRRRRRRKRRKL